MRWVFRVLKSLYLLVVLLSFLSFLDSCGNPLSEAELESALPTQVDFPSGWETEMGTISVDWKVSRTTYYAEGKAPFYATSAIIREWTDKGEVGEYPMISVSIFQYRNVPMAFLRYRLSKPEYAYHDWPNFTFPDRERYPSTWQYHSSFADEEYAVCGMGKLKGCQVWFYWARHGRYLVEVFFFAPNQGIGPELFEKIVAQVDPYIGQRLQQLK